MYYEEVFRGKVVDQIRKGKSYRDVAKTFEVSTNSIWRWKKMEEEQGHLKNRPLNRKHKKVDPIKIIQYINNHKDAYATEMAKHFKVQPSSILYILKNKLNFVRKKNSGPIANETKIVAQNSEKSSKKSPINRLYTWMKRV